MNREYQAIHPVSRILAKVPKHTLLQIAIVFAVLGLSIVLAMKSDRRLLMLVLAMPAGYLSLQLLNRWPSLGILALVVGSYLMRQNIGPVNIVIVLPLALIGLWLLNMVTLGGHIKFNSSPTFVPLLLFIVVAVIAFISGQLPWFLIQSAPIQAQIGGILIIVAAVLIYIITAHYLEDIHWLKIIVWLFIFLGTLAILSRVSPIGRSYIRSWFADGAFGSVFWLWFVGLSFSNSLFNKELKLPWRVLLMIIAMVTLYNAAVVNGDWLSGWLPAVVVLGVIVWIGLPRLSLPVFILAGLAMLGLGLGQVIFDGLAYGDNSYSTFTRLEAWRVMFEIIKVNPILGVGPSNYYWYTPLYNIMGWHVQFNSHNNFIDIAAQTGLTGLACILWFFWSVSRLGLSLRSRVPPGGFVYAFVLAANGGLAGTLVASMLGDWVLPFFYNVGVNGFRASAFGWMFLGALVAIEQMLKTGKLNDQHTHDKP